jgi:magnesium chelatase subunit D
VVREYREGWALSWAATLRAAASRQVARTAGGLVLLRPEDLRGRLRPGPGGRLLLFVVDASGSMAAWRRMRQAKAAVLSLLVPAYQRRDRVALVAFHGRGAEVVLPPARGLGRARRALERLPTGGATPLADGLAAARRLLGAERRRRPRQPAWAVLLTDGRANAGGAGAWAAALREARALAGCGAALLVVDTEAGPCRLGRAAALAAALGAPCLPLEDALGRPLADYWRDAV